MVRRLLVAALSVGAVLSMNHLPVPEFEINLDDEPEERFAEVLAHFGPLLRKFVNEKIHGNTSVVKRIADAVVLKRGRETEELQREINGIAKHTGIQKNEVHALQLFYEINSLMVPVVNFTHGSADMDLIQELLGEVSSNWDVPEPIHVGCTGIIATSDEDGTVYHARNLDFSFSEYLQPMVYTGIFKKGGSEIFRAQTISGYSSVLTGMRKGPNGYTIEINTRFTDHVGGNSEMIKNVFTNHITPSGFTKRKILETVDNYEDAVEAFSTSPYSSTEYNIVSGVKKGTILARNPEGLAYQLPLSESGKKYIIMTNFDYIWHDVKEIFDPTGGKGIFHPRRKPAEAILDNADPLTPETLWTTINDFEVMAKDTIFQVIMDVETGYWNASLPACTKCNQQPAVVV